MRFQLANVHLADERRNILIVLVARLGLGDADLSKARWRKLHHGKLRNVPAKFIEPLEAPWTHRRAEPTPRNAVALFQNLCRFSGIEQAKGAFKDRADFLPGLQGVDRVDLHQRFEPLGQRRFSAADRTEQIENLPALLEALRCVTEETDDTF